MLLVVVRVGPSAQAAVVRSAEADPRRWAVTSDGHYEVELFEPGHADKGARWRPVTVTPDNTIPTPLVFGSLSEARSYIERGQPAAVRIMWVMEEGKRLVVETIDP